MRGPWRGFGVGAEGARRGKRSQVGSTARTRGRPPACGCIAAAAELDVDGVRVELLDDPQSRCALACAEIGLPPPDADGAFGGLMLQANFLLRGTEGATLCQNPETGAYALVRPFPLALADVESLGAGLESLVNQTENWRPFGALNRQRLLHREPRQVARLPANPGEEA